MSLKIKKMTGEIFDLPPNYVIEAEKTTHCLQTKGAKQFLSISRKQIITGGYCYTPIVLID